MIGVGRIGNPSDKATRWFITINNPSEEEIQALKDQDYKFLVIAHERAPTTGTEHIHALITFQSQKRWTTLKRSFPRANIEKVHGTFRQAYEYVTKNGDILFERGDKPRTGNGDTFKQMVQEAKTGDIDTECLMYCRYERFFQRFMPKVQYTYDGELDCKNAWIYGPPGTGKSLLVRIYAEERGYRIYNKLANKWWDGYNGEEIVLVEDLDPEVCSKLVHHIKLWADRYTFTGEVKGSSIRVEPSFQLIITSNFSLHECFTGPDSEAVFRRFDVLFFIKEWSEEILKRLN